MDWRDIPSLSALRAFEAAARLGSLSAAARELNVTHAAIAQHVRTLEARFGIALLRRDGQRMAATEAGADLADALSDGFGTIAAGVRDLIERDRQRPLRVAVTPTFAANWLMPRLGTFWTAHPDIALEVLPSTDLVDLARDRVDVAIRYGRGDWPGTRSEPLLTAPYIAVASPALPGARRVHDLAELADLPWLIVATDTEDRLFAETHGLDLAAMRVREMATSDLVRQAALAGVGVALLTEPVAADDVAAGRLMALYRQEGAEVAYHMLTRPGTRSPARDVFTRWLREAAAS